MAYSNEIVARARQRLEQARADRESQTRDRLAQVYKALPRVKEIDLSLRRSMALAARTVFTQGTDAQAAFETLKQENLALQQEKQRLIADRFGPDFLNEAPICPRCGGSGYVGTAMCPCLQELCRQEQEKELTLLASPEQNFDAFRLDYYPEEPDPKYGVSPRMLMEKTYRVCREYAQSFGPGSGNLLFVGGTGLGKTFLSACIARTAAARGVSVMYLTAQELFSRMEKNQFNGDEQTRRQVKALMECDLLIIDDLGTELPGAFVTTALYSVVNTRLLERRSMVISTNLLAEEISRRYSPQIGSRLQGDFRRLPFVGQDIRILKNRGL